MNIKCNSVFGLALLTGFSSIWSQDLSVETVLQVAHSEKVTTMAFSADGNTFASADNFGTAKLWDIRSGRLLRTIKADKGKTWSVAFSPDGKLLATGGLDQAVKMWEISTGKLLHTYDASFSGWGVFHIAFSPSGKLLASSSGEVLALWDLQSGKKKYTFKAHSKHIISIAFSPDERFLVTGGQDYKAIVWALSSGQRVATLEHSGWVERVAISPDSRTLATQASSEYNIRLWDLANLKQIAHVSSTYLTLLGFAPEGEMLVMSDSSCSTVSNRDHEELIPKVRIVSFNAGSPLLSPDGKIVADYSKDQITKLWNVNCNVRGNQEDLLCSTIKLRDGKNGRVLRALTGVNYLGSDAVAFTPNNVLVNSGSSGIQIWDFARGTGYYTEKGGRDGEDLRSVRISPNGVTIATSYSHGINVWNLSTGERLYTLKPNSDHDDRITCLAFAPDSRIVASGGLNGQIKLWDLETRGQIQAASISQGQRIRTGVDNSVLSIVFSPDGKTLAACNEYHRVKILDARSLKELLHLSEKHPAMSFDLVPYALSYSPDGKTLACGNSHGIIALWDVNTGMKLSSFKGPESDVICIAFSPDGKILAAGSRDNTIRLWDIKTGKEIFTMTGHIADVGSLAFSSDGKMIASVSYHDIRIILWDVRTGKELVTLIPIEPSDYVLITPDNYYSASRGALDAIAFRMGTKVFPLEQFDLKFNRPDTVLQRIGWASQELVGSYRKAFQKRLSRMNFREEMLTQDFHVPEISVLNQDIPLSTKNKTLEFTVKASDTKYLLDRLCIYANNVPIYGVDGINLRGKKLSAIEQNISVNLSAGRNKIQVSVLNDKGAESLKETFEISCDGPVTKPDLYVVVVGVSDYLDNTMDLKYASKDANDLATFFESQKSNFGKVKVQRLLDKGATKESIARAKKDLMQSQVGDQVVLFVAGHGLLDDKLDWYFATHDVDFRNPSSRGISYDELETLLDGIPARRKLILMDACHSGEVDKEESVLIAGTTTSEGAVKSRAFKAKKVAKKTIGLQNSFELMQHLFADIQKGSGAMVISSAGGAEYAFESSEWNNGVFTYALLEGLKTKHADTNKDGKIFVSELRNHVIEKVQKLTGGKQNPTSRKENFEFDFTVY